MTDKAFPLALLAREPSRLRLELRNLRWRDVDLLEGVLPVRASKSQEGVRSIALPRPLVATLAEQYRRTQFKGEA